MSTNISVVDDYTLARIQEGAAQIITIGGPPPGYETEKDEEEKAHVMTATKVVKAPAKAAAAKTTEGVETK